MRPDIYAPKIFVHLFINSSRSIAIPVEITKMKNVLVILMNYGTLCRLQTSY